MGRPKSSPDAKARAALFVSMAVFTAVMLSLSTVVCTLICAGALGLL